MLFFLWDPAYHKKINMLPGVEYNATWKGEPESVLGLGFFFLFAVEKAEKDS